MNLIRTTAANPDFVMLVKALDANLAIKDGDDHAFYDQFNKIDALRYVILLYDGEQALGCGAIKPYDDHTMEVKRMYVQPSHRGRGIASRILTALEDWARELNYSRCILETGITQTDAVALYHKRGYLVMPNYGQYAGVENSVCFEKALGG